MSDAIALVYRLAVTAASRAKPTPSKAQLADLISALQVELVALKTQLRTQAVESETRDASLRETIVNLTHENELLKRRLFGTKSERSQTSELQLTLGNLLDAEKQLERELNAAVQSVEDADGDGPSSPAPSANKKKPKGRRDLSASSLFLLEVLDEQLEATAKRIGWEESLQLMFRRGGYMVLVKRTAKYEVPGKNGPTVVGVESPKTLFRRGLLHSSVIAHIIAQKFALGVPHYRLEQSLQEQDAKIDRGTMCRYVDEAGGTLGSTVVHAMWQDALHNACMISTDATSAMIQPGKSNDGRHQACKKGHFFTAVADCDHVLFAYSEKHNQDSVKRLFGNYKGFLQADASNVYDILDRGPPKDTGDAVVLVGCFAHLRRYFFEAAICKYPVGVQGLMRIRAMYAIEDSFKGLPPEKRKLMRDQHLRPLLEAFFEWVEQARSSTPGRNLATRALGYASNQKRELMRVLEDGRLPLDNTRANARCERSSWDARTGCSMAATLTLRVLQRCSPSSRLVGCTRSIPSSTSTRYYDCYPTGRQIDSSSSRRTTGAPPAPSSIPPNSTRRSLRSPSPPPKFSRAAQHGYRPRATWAWCSGYDDGVHLAYAPDGS